MQVNFFLFLGYPPATFGYQGQTSSAKFTIPAEQQASLSNDLDLSLFFKTRKALGLIFYIGTNPANIQSSSTYITAYVDSGLLKVCTE